MEKHKLTYCVPLTHHGSAAAQCPGLVAALPVGSVGVFQLVAACC